MLQAISEKDYSTLQAARLVIDRILEGAGLAPVPSSDLRTYHTQRKRAAKPCKRDREMTNRRFVAQCLGDNQLSRSILEKC